MSYQSRITVHEGNFDASRYTDESNLIKAYQDRSTELTPIITFLFGSWQNTADKFPLLYSTEGQIGGTASKPVGTIEYHYPIMGKRKVTETVVSSPYSANDLIGAGNSEIIATFRSNWFPDFQTIISPDGYQCRVLGKQREGDYYRYRLQYLPEDTEGTSYIPASQFAAGAVWGIVGAATVATSLSVGNTGRVQTPGRRKNQIGVMRQSYRLGGNIANKVVEFQLFDTNGGPVTYWLDFYEFQQMINWRVAKEEQLWTALYNRNAQGQITTIDPELNQAVPIPSGVKQQIVNRSSYSDLTTRFLDTIVGDIFTDTAYLDGNAMEIGLYAGKGFRAAFDDAMKDSALFRQVAQGVGKEFVKSRSGGLELGGVFTSYLHRDSNRVITIKDLPFLNEGGYAERSHRHPITGWPMSSYEAYFIDHSSYSGVKNMQLLHEEGRMEIRGLEQGMSLVKGSQYSDYNGNGKYLQLATEQDVTSIHYLCTYGIQMLNNQHTFMLTPDVSEMGF